MILYGDNPPLEDNFDSFLKQTIYVLCILFRLYFTQLYIDRNNFVFSILCMGHLCSAVLLPIIPLDVNFLQGVCPGRGDLNPKTWRYNITCLTTPLGLATMQIFLLVNPCSQSFPTSITATYRSLICPRKKAFLKVIIFITPQYTSSSLDPVIYNPLTSCTFLLR